MRQELLTKYSVPVPRYTSYPPANYFNESFTGESYRNAILESNKKDPQHISIYIHIPFCYQMCFYCGCNSQLFKDNLLVDKYIEALKKEIRMVLPLLDKERKISQIHYGGGTPTSLPIAILQDINQMILSEFDCIEDPEIAIECHPGYMDEEYWMQLIEIGFNRVSIGIQDFDKNVLEVVNRKSPRMPIEEVVDLLRAKGLPINMDFIYGLPLQTPETFSTTIKKAIALRPDRIVTFSYAHVPWVNELQKKLEEAGLPSISMKNEIFEQAKQLLMSAGYEAIGLDHFVLPKDELYQAQQSKALHRNFQGYCTRRTTGQVYAFGITGISQLASAYSQNTKDIDTYITQVNEGILPVAKGYILTVEEQITRSIISELMCNYSIVWEEVALLLDKSIEQVRNAINYDTNRLEEFSKDGLIEYDENHIKMLPHARALVRNVAASLDKLMLNTDKRYSKSV